MMRSYSMTGLYLLALTACQQPGDSARAGPAKPLAGNDVQARAVARLATAEGAARGEASASQTVDGLAITLNATGMQPGTYGVHLHTVGMCEGPKFVSAGGHWNPSNRQHGADNPQGAHAGDLPNLTIAANGAGMVTFTIPGARLNGGAMPLLDADGASFMVHAKPDDYRTDPSGASGDRIACGVFGAS